MIKTQTFCDACNKEFTSTYWDEQPCSIQLKLGGPAQSYESRDSQHVCHSCRKAIVAAWDNLFAKKP